MFKNIIFDMDGVLWRGADEIGDLSESFKVLEANDVKFALATNNSTKRLNKYVEKLAGFDVHVKEEQIFTSGTASAYYLKKIYPAGTRAYVIGESGLKAFMEDAGFVLVEEDAEIVLVGLDREINYDKLAKAGQFILYNNATFYGTNADPSFPSANGLVPGAGAMLSPITTTTGGVEPICFGKPSPTMYEQALDYLGALPEETLMVGDRVDTDATGAQKLGIKTAVVLSGVASREDVEAHTPKVDYVAEDLDDLLKQLYG